MTSNNRSTNSASRSRDCTCLAWAIGVAVAFLFVVPNVGCSTKPDPVPSLASEKPDDSASSTAASVSSEPGIGLAATPQPVTEERTTSAAAKEQTAASSSVAKLEQRPGPADSALLRREAKEFAEELLRDVPNNPDALEVKARFHLLFGETEAAKQCWQDAIALAPDYAYAQHGLGRIAMLNGDYEQAVDYIQKSIPSQPDNAEPVHHLSDSFVKLGRIDDSIAILQSFAKKNAGSTQTFVLLGFSYLAGEKFELAETAFRTALKQSPGLARAEQGLGTALLRLDKRDEAKQLLAKQQASRAANQNRTQDEVFRDELNECSLRYGIGAKVYLALGYAAKGEAAARRSLALNPLNSESKAILVALFQKQGRLAEAIELARQLCAAHKLNPSWPYTLGILLAQQGDLEAARDAFSEVIQLAPDKPEGYDSLARLLIRRGKDLQDAIPVARKVVEARGWAADHELLAQAYAVNADFPRAFASLSEAIRLAPTNKDYAEAMKQLRRAMGRE